MNKTVAKMPKSDKNSFLKVVVGGFRSFHASVFTILELPHSLPLMGS